MSLTAEQLATMRRLNRATARRVKAHRAVEKSAARHAAAAERFYDARVEEANLYALWREQTEARHGARP